MSRNSDPHLDQLELPPSLERVGRGIRVAGHRVSLFQILDALFDATPIERLREMFPTIPPPKLDEVVAFSRQHPDLMRRYHAEQHTAFAALASRHRGSAPTLAELRRRKAERAALETRTD